MKRCLRLWLFAFMLPAAMASAADEAFCSGTPAAQDALLKQVTRQVEALYGGRLQVALEPMAPLPALAQPRVRVLTRTLSSRVALELAGTACGTERPMVSTVWFRMQAQKEAWVYGRTGKVDSAVLETSPKKQMVDLAALQLAEEELVDEPAGLWLAQAVNAGAPVLKKQLKTEPLVKRNETVSVVVRGSGLLLSAQGVALQQGSLGARVPVQVRGATSSIQGVVAGRGEIHVEM